MRKLILTVAAATILGTACQAAVVLSDNFSYTNGPLVDVSGGVWANHSGTVGTLGVTNGQLVVRGGTSYSEDANADLAGAPYLETDFDVALYSSYTIIISNAASLPGQSGTYISHFRGTNSGAATDFGARVWLSTTNAILGGTTTDTGSYRVNIANGTAGGVSFGQYDMNLSTGTVYTVVTRFVPSTGLATLWIDPLSEADPSITGEDFGTSTRPNPFNVFTYAFRQSGGIAVYIDNLKVGTSFNDVVGSNTSPLVSGIPDQAVGANTVVGPLDFTVSDAESPATSLTVTASSSNKGLVPDANLALGGGGTNRTILITPASNQEGLTVITVNVSDGLNSSFTTFEVRFGYPTITTIEDQQVLTNSTTAPIAFTIGDAETPGNLTLSASSSNPLIVSDAKLILSGTGANRSLQITPEPEQAGQSVITVNVHDGVNTSSTSFVLTVYPHWGLLLGDDFTYADGPIGSVSSSFWTAHSGLSNDTYIVSNQLLLTQTNVDDVRAFFTNSISVPTSSGVLLYSKFTASLGALPRFSGGYFAHLKDTGTQYRSRVFAVTNDAAPGKFRFAISNGGNTPTAFPADLDLGTTYTVVERYNVGSAKATLWVNPASEESPSVTASDITSAVEIWNYAFRQDGTSGAIGVVTLDDFLLGTSFTDVVPYIPPPTPEKLGVSLSGGNLVLTWSNPAFFLASATNPAGPYTRVQGATSPYSVSVAGEPRFFRLVWP